MNHIEEQVVKHGASIDAMTAWRTEARDDTRRLFEAVEKVSTDLGSLRATLESFAGFDARLRAVETEQHMARGGFKTLVAVGALSGSVGGFLAWLGGLLHNKH